MSEQTANGAHGRVLIAEDEADLAWVERFNLETEGYEVEVAGEGRAALEAMNRFEPDLVILDLMLPHVDGWSVLEQMQQLPDERRPKVIVVSAAAGVGDQERAENMGAGTFLAKPFDIDELLEAVAQVIRS